ncbi:hypothetical protein M422DRAFT_261178 [Sphaerobolus stellatus SS14]|uniref:Uncharacterized protein n=1 Tax=Sphaerobolus stellatus (strain SS14) TaxID=990650 RepID=A0A0C9UNP9_SPHS4|nr:hypothetical protein M422DRAFT_261178 [Sphaerobolus stellatus SS14]
MQEIGKDAGWRERKVEPWFLAVRHDPKNWRRKSVHREMAEWIRGMDHSLFERGSVVEIFLWTYTLFMLSGAGKAGKKDWCVEAVRNTCAWLLIEAELMVEGIINDCGAVLLSGSSILETLRPIKGVSQLVTRGVDDSGSAKPAIAIVESTAGCPPSSKAAVATVSNVVNPVEHDSQPAAKPAMAIIESTAGQPPVLLAAVAAASNVAAPIKHGGGIISLSDAVKEATEDASLVVITKEVTLTARRPRKPASTMGLAGVKSEAVTAKAEGEKTTNEKKATRTESKKTSAKSAKNEDKKPEDPPTMRTTRGRKGKGV